MSRIVFYPERAPSRETQKIYYCGHPEDLDRCFSAVFQDLHEAIPYRRIVLCREADPAATPEEIDLALGEAKLLVVPVTHRFLTGESRARTVELPLALAHRMPVLPILFDPPDRETVAAFGAIFGNLQFLYKYDTDPTAISYGEKLRKYLSDRILDDDTAEKVRKAFDAYIFLSYRKKDRKYARELMRLIHENEFCRDLAIWYDEFLSPGEDFNETIAAALEKSALFALAVTPNLVNEVNYVMTTEYPMARDANKPILPAEVVPTDGAELREKYKDISDAVDAYDAPVLSEELMRRLEGIALRANDSDPQHNFFIGLAYLSGIDVEINRERALRMITSSAEAGLPEAMDKLFRMYRDGDGVSADFRTALLWKKRETEFYRTRYETDPSRKNARAYVKIAQAYGQSLTSFYRRDEAVAYYKELLTLLSSEGFPDPELQRKATVACYEVLGNIAYDEGNLEQAEPWYHKALEFCPEVLSPLQRGRILLWQASILFRRGAAAQSEVCGRQALSALEQGVPEEDSVGAECLKSDLLILLGRISLDRKDSASAKAFYQAAGEVPVVSKTGYNLSAVLIGHAQVAEMEHDRVQAKELYRIRIQNDEWCVRHRPEPAFASNLAYACYSYAYFLQQDGEYSEAEKYFRRAIDLYTDLEQRYARKNPMLPACYEYLGYTKIVMHEIDPGCAFLQKALDLTLDLALETEAEGDYVSLAECYGRVSAYLDPEQEKEALRRAWDIYRQLAEQKPEYLPRCEAARRKWEKANT